MQDIERMQRSESDHRLNQHAPYLALLEELLPLLALHNLLVEIPVVRKLHDDAAYPPPYHKFLPSRKTSLYPTMLLLFRLARMRT